jgi:hypothetical protein
MLPGSSYRQVIAVLDGDECVKLLRDGDWVATAQPASPLCPPIRQPRRRGLR